MPCYHFIFHGYGTWMPDEDEGYVKRKQGRLPQDLIAAAAYRELMTDDVVNFDEAHQKTLIDEVQVTAAKTNLRVHFVATEPTHLHAVVSWKDDRPWLKVRTSLKSSLSRRMKRDHDRREWLSEGASRKKVVNQEHFDYLVCTYLPGHRGWKWSEEQGLHK
jgi:REP element-mobilizing transposase RayT